MKAIGFRPSFHHAAIGFPVAVAIALLSGCAGGDDGSSKAQAPVAQTVTASIAPAPAAPAPGATTSTSAPAPATTKGNISKRALRSDDVGRKFDVGTIVRVEHVKGVPVLVLDRYSYFGMPDSDFATKGVRIASHQDVWFENRNGKVTYRIPVAPGAVFTRLTCVLEHAPARRPSTLAEFTRLRYPRTSW